MKQSFVQRLKLAGSEKSVTAFTFDENYDKCLNVNDVVDLIAYPKKIYLKKFGANRTEIYSKIHYGVPNVLARKHLKLLILMTALYLILAGTYIVMAFHI